MDTLTAIQYLQQQGFLIISKEELDTIIEIAATRAIELYEKKQRQSRLYSKKEVAEMIGVHPSTISSWIKHGKLKTTASGKITYAQLLKLISDENS